MLEEAVREKVLGLLPSSGPAVGKPRVGEGEGSVFQASGVGAHRGFECMCEEVSG